MDNDFGWKGLEETKLVSRLSNESKSKFGFEAKNLAIFTEVICTH